MYEHGTKMLAILVHICNEVSDTTGWKVDRVSGEVFVLGIMDNIKA